MKYKKSCSVALGDPALDHNRRSYTPDNVDENLMKNNVYIKTCASSDFKKEFNDLFSDAISEYNSKQKRKDRKKDDYYQEILESKNGEKPIYEYVIQFGDMNDTNVKDDNDSELMKELLVELAEEFPTKFPNFHVVSSTIHCDEQTPHWHLSFTPFAHGYTTGMSKRCSFTRACEEMGLKKTIFKNAQGSNVTHYNCNAFLDKMYMNMEEKLQSRGYEREFKGCEGPGVKINEFKNRRDVETYFKQKWNAYDLKTNELLSKEEELEQKKSVLKQEGERLKQLDVNVTKRVLEANSLVLKAEKEVSEKEKIKQELEEVNQSLKSEIKGSKLTLEEINSINPLPTIIGNGTKNVNPDTIINLIVTSRFKLEEEKERAEFMDRREETQNNRDKKQDDRDKKQDNRDKELEAREIAVNRDENELKEDKKTFDRYKKAIEFEYRSMTNFINENHKEEYKDYKIGKRKQQQKQIESKAEQIKSKDMSNEFQRF